MRKALYAFTLVLSKFEFYVLQLYTVLITWSMPSQSHSDCGAASHHVQRTVSMSTDNDGCATLSGVISKLTYCTPM